MKQTITSQMHNTSIEPQSQLQGQEPLTSALQTPKRADSERPASERPASEHQARLSSASATEPLELRLIPKQIFWRMTLAILGLVAISGLGQIGYAYWPNIPGMGLAARLSDVDAERSFPTAYSSLALLACAGLQAAIARFPLLSSRGSTQYWQWLALIFLSLSLDELLGFHELAIEPLRERFELDGVFYFAWVLPAIVLVSLFGLSFFRFWLHLPKHPRRLFLLAAFLFISGALGIEMINGAYVSYWGETWAYLALQHLEEFLEMWGIAVFIYGLLSYIRARLDRGSLLLRL